MALEVLTSFIGLFFIESFLLHLGLKSKLISVFHFWTKILPRGLLVNVLRVILTLECFFVLNLLTKLISEDSNDQR